MDVGRAVRRGSVHLRNIGSSHKSLSMVISQLRDVKSTYKGFINAQNMAAQDIMKWAHQGENCAIKDVCSHMADLFALWAEIQKELLECVKQFRMQFEMILEGERSMDRARENLEQCEQKRIKVKKELNKATRRSEGGQIEDLKLRLADTEKATTMAHLAVVQSSKDNETTKLIRLRKGLLKLSDVYCDVGLKCQVVFDAQRDIAREIPSPQQEEVFQMKYSGFAATKQAALKAKEHIQLMGRPSPMYSPTAPPGPAGHASGRHSRGSSSDPPPPYSGAYSSPDSADGCSRRSLGCTGGDSRCQVCPRGFGCNVSPTNGMSPTMSPPPGSPTPRYSNVDDPNTPSQQLLYPTFNDMKLG